MNHATLFAHQFPYAAEISEKHRKYLCKFRWKQQDYYAIWGTEMCGETQDQFLTDRYKRIMISRNSQKPFRYVLDNQVNSFADTENIQTWLVEFAQMDRFRKAYYFYSLDADRAVIEKLETRQDLNYESALKVLNFLWLVVDYIEPCHRKDLIKLYESPPVSRFLACMLEGYAVHFPKSRFSIPKLKENLWLLFEGFEKAFRIV